MPAFAINNGGIASRDSGVAIQYRQRLDCFVGIRLLAMTAFHMSVAVNSAVIASRESGVAIK